MRKRTFKKSAACLLTGLTCVLSVPAIPTAVFNTAYAAGAGQTFTVGNGMNQHKADNVDGYSYEIWLDNTGGSGSMTLGSGGSFNTEWSAQVSRGNFLARRGRNYDASKKATQYGSIVMEYAADYSASSQGNSRLCVYGWMKDPLVEYYIIEDWVNWCPSGNSQTVTIDGAEYEIFQTDHTGPTILGDTRTFKQYFSIRKQKRTSGTITVSDHFKAWEKAGWNIGNLTEVALNVEGWESSGKANVSKLSISAGSGNNNNSQQQNNNTQQNNGWNQQPQQQQQQNNGWNWNNWNQQPQQQNNNQQSNTSVSSSDSLKSAFSSYFKIGTSVSPHELGSGADFLKKHYNSITPENELKPDSLLDKTACQQRGNNVNTQISLSKAAQTLKFCEQNGIALRGHTFVWYSQTPEWFFKENFQDNGAWVSKEVMNQRLESMIKNTFEALKTQYPNLEVYSYDVCNELFLNDGGGMRPAGGPGSGGSYWVQVYGDDSFVTNAFTYARKYAPAGCKLYLNDYNEYIPAKTNDIYNMAMKLKQLGVIDGIGMQSHLDTQYPDANTYETALKKFLSTGLEVQITELDITCNNESAQADLYEKIFKLAMQNSAQIPALTIWGTQDSVSWRSSQNPLLFKSGYQPKQAYDKVMALAKGGSITPQPAATTAQQWQQPATTTTVATTQWQQQNNNNQWNPQNNQWPQQQQQNQWDQQQWNQWNSWGQDQNWNQWNNNWDQWNNQQWDQWNSQNQWSQQVSTWGDANNNNNVDIGDAVAIMQSLANPDKYGFDDQNRYNADVYQAGTGVTAQDATAIQRYLLQSSNQLPESYWGDWGNWTQGNSWDWNQWNQQGQQWEQPQQQNNNQNNNNQNNNWNQPQQQSTGGGQTFSVGNGMNQHKADNVDGYSYEIWLDNTGGSGSMTLGSGGSFNTEWSAQVSRGNFLARRGRNYDASKKATQYGTIVMDYAADYSASSQGNSRLCVYGWMKDPLVEYYIIEDWVNWRPTANGGAQTVTIDGAEYEIFQLDHTGPTILGDTRTFKQYFSVRKSKRTSGTITVSDHFKAWEKAGWNIGNLTEVALNVEGWESSGKANVSKLTISAGNGNNNNTQQQNNNTQQQQNTQQNNNQQQNNGWNQQPQQNNGWDWNNWNQQPQQQNNNQNNSWNQPQQQSVGGGQTFSVGNGMNQHKADNVDGYSYEIWLDNTGGSGSMTLGSGGSFNTEWSAQVNAGNFLARRGRNYDASKKATQYGSIVMDYAADYSASAQGNSRLCVYGWMKDPLVEYYIIEDWVNWRPTANGGAQTVTIDGAEYEIFQLDHTGPTILGDTRTFKQYFSVRKQKRTSGTITVSDHFAAWEKAGWNIGNLTEVALNVEGWESSGKANVSKLTISAGSGNSNNNQQQSWTQPQQQNNGWGNPWDQQQPANTTVQVSTPQDLSGKKLVAISFDDGASAQSRQDPAYRIMDALIQNNFHATFFYVSDWIKTNEQVKFAYENGMEVANHTKSHKSLGSLDAGTIRSEWEQCNSKLKSIIGVEPSHIMRLPYLDGGGQVKSALYDVPLISCGLDTKDWDGASADQIVNTIKSAAQNGSLQNQIVLCHENYASTAQAMETVLPWLKQNGWEVVTVSEMFAANGKQLQGGQIYTRS